MADPCFDFVIVGSGAGGLVAAIMVNEHAQVMRSDGSVIDGLYAAGNCAASLCGPHYVGAGQSIGASSVAGFIAANMSAR